MIHRSLVVTVLLALASSVAGLGAGCSGPPRTEGSGATAASELIEAAELIRRSQVQVGETLAALDALEAMEGGTLPELLAAYERDLLELQRIANAVDRTRDRMRADGEAYFQRWDEAVAAINDTTLRERSQERRRLVSRSLSGLQVDYETLADQYERFESLLADIQGALRMDLNAGGVAAVSDAADRARAQGMRVTETAGRVASAFEALGVNMGATPAVGVPMDTDGDGLPDRIVPVASEDDPAGAGD